MSDFLDRYQLRARVQPALLAALPVGWTLAVVFGVQHDALSAIAAFAGGAGVTYFIAHLVRDRGRKLEPFLWESWGGAPTTQLLRGLPGEPDDTTRRRWSIMRRLMPELEQPTGSEDPGDAETNLYVPYLRERTRNGDEFPLIASENAGYGFRRNMYGLRPLAICVASLASAIALADMIYEFVIHHDLRADAAGVVLVLDLALVVVWISVVTSAWVKTQGFAYARALLGGAENLSPLSVQDVGQQLA